MRTDICSAINAKKVIQFYYNGGTRLVEPFCYGVHRDTGNEKEGTRLKSIEAPLATPRTGQLLVQNSHCLRVFCLGRLSVELRRPNPNR